MNNPLLHFLSLHFTISQNGISRHPEIYFNAVMSNCFIICGKGEFTFLYHLLKGNTAYLFPLLLFFEFHEIKFQ